MRVMEVFMTLIITLYDVKKYYLKRVLGCDWEDLGLSPLYPKLCVNLIMCHFNDMFLQRCVILYS